MARAIVLVTGLSGAFGAAGAATGIAGKWLCDVSPARLARLLGAHDDGTTAWSRLRSRAPRHPALAVAGVTGLLAGGTALVGPRAWLVVALGGVATGALALSVLAPPSPGRHQRLPRLLRVAVALISALALVGALAGAGVWALIGAGGLAVAGVVTAGPRRPGPPWPRSSAPRTANATRSCRESPTPWHTRLCPVWRAFLRP